MKTKFGFYQNYGELTSFVSSITINWAFVTFRGLALYREKIV